MKDKLKIKDLTPKNALAIAIVVVVIVAVVWFLWDKAAAAIAEAKAKERLKKEKAKYGATTLDESQISSLAIQLYNAFKPSLWNWGTNEKVVERVLSQLGNNADYAALKIAYASVNKDSLDMDGRIDYEGNEKEKARWRAILEAKGITVHTF